MTQVTAVSAEQAMALFEEFRRLHEAGAYAVEVECVAAETLAALSARTPLVTHSIGSGSGGDVVFLFTGDICGEAATRPRHAKAFGNLHGLYQQIAQERIAALEALRTAVSDGSISDTARVHRDGRRRARQAA
jgi:3-methyl-2-oxobutanoate hydroxymethyltransferase